MSTVKYIALTLGPISRTIDMAENTRSLWAASYLFSYIGKQIILPFIDRHFLLPYISKEMFEETFKGAGVFPDRYIFKAENIQGKDDFDVLKKRAEIVINELASYISKETKDGVGETEAFLKRFLKIYFFEKEFDSNDEKKIKESCEKSLSLLEMQDTIVPKVDDTKLFLNKLFDGVKNSFLAKDAGLDNGFPSIVEISSGDSVEMPKHPYQRYVAVVKADGDSMGRAFEEEKDSNLLSKALFDFNKKAVKIINEYNGLPVYIGGDDLLFFAPIFTTVKTEYSSMDVSLFSLLQELDNAFHKSIEITKLKNHPTLSFGVSITYYKYPMFEALRVADSLLTNAKSAKSEKPLKNNIVFSVQKHSGQTRAALLHKGNKDTLYKFNELVNDFMNILEKNSAGKSDEKKMLTSVMHGLREKEALLSIAIKEETTINNFFENNYNELVHKKYGKFFNDIKCLLWTAYQEFSKENKLDRLEGCFPKSMMIATPEKAAIETLYNALQFVHLINQRKDERDESI